MSGWLITLPTMASLPPLFYLAPVGALIALLMAFVFYRGFMAQSEGDENMVRIAQAVREGAYAYLGRQARVVYLVIAVLAVVLLFMAFSGLQSKLTWLGVAVAASLSGLCGYLGMRTATNASARTAAAAKQSLNDGLRVAFRAGAVMGLCVTGFALLDVSVWFGLLSSIWDVNEVGQLVLLTTVTLSFAMGASLQALFARVGGGIYTKAADVGADLVGKVEAGIPEDDARNPATIADNVGDNVGDVAGMGADLYESYYGSILAAMALAAAASVRLQLAVDEALALIIAPPALAGLGIIMSVLSIFAVRAKENANFAQLLKSLHGGVWLSSALVVLASAGLLYLLLKDVSALNWVGVWGAILAGLVAGLVIAWGTERYTSYEHKPTQNISEQAQTGPATVIIAGVAEGMRSTWIPLLSVVVAIQCAFIFAGGKDTFLMGVFGVGIAAVGMLSTLGITLATDAYGPIADNAGGNAEMTHQPPHVRERTDMLDSLGNTTAATGKGFAIGSAALTALALLAAYVTTVQANLSQQGAAYVAADARPALSDKWTYATADASAVYLGSGLLAVQLPGGATDTALVDRKAFEGALDSSRGFTVDFAGMTATFLDATGQKAMQTVELVRTSSATLPQIMGHYDVTLMNPKVLCGLFIGVMLVFVFCSMTMNAVGRAAYAMMNECRRQFEIMKDAFKKQGMSDADLADPLKWPFEVENEGH